MVKIQFDCPGASKISACAVNNVNWALFNEDMTQMIKYDHLKPDSQGILPEQTSTVLALLEPMKKYRLVGLNSKWNQMVGLGLAQKIRGTAAAGRVAKNGGSDWGGMRVRVIDVSREDKLKQQGSRFGNQPPNYPDDYKFSKIAGYA
jgi:hypothetical protein